jgi:hypothetical protein
MSIEILSSNIILLNSIENPANLRAFKTIRHSKRPIHIQISLLKHILRIWFNRDFESHQEIINAFNSLLRPHGLSVKEFVFLP